MVSIIILSYNTQELLRSCLASIYKNLHGVQFEVIVFDNASRDDSVSMVKKEFKKVILIESSMNLGFGKGINTAARKAHGEYLIFLNSDARILEGHVNEIISVLEHDPTIGIVGGVFENDEGTFQKSFGKFAHLPEVIRLLFFGERFVSPYKSFQAVQYVDWVSGGFMTVRKDDFLSFGGFDEHFFMYIEDMELCFRMKKKDLKVCVIPTAKIAHKGHGSSNRTFAIVHIFKGLRYFYKKHKSPVQYVMLEVLLYTKSLLAIAVGLVTFRRQLVTTYTQAAGAYYEIR